MSKPRVREIEGATLISLSPPNTGGGRYRVEFAGEQVAVANQVSSHKWEVEGRGKVVSQDTLDMAVGAWLRVVGFVAMPIREVTVKVPGSEWGAPVFQGDAEVRVQPVGKGMMLQLLNPNVPYPGHPDYVESSISLSRAEAEAAWRALGVALRKAPEQ